MKMIDIYSLRRCRFFSETERKFRLVNFLIENYYENRKGQKNGYISYKNNFIIK